MKKLLLSLIVTAMVTTAVVAQDSKSQDSKSTKPDRTEWEKKVKDELKLTDDQTIKYNALNKEYNEKMDAVANDATSSKDVQKEKKMALKKEKEAKMNEFLTPEQQTKYKEMMDKKKKEMEAKPGA